MKVRFFGENCVSLTTGQVYEVLRLIPMFGVDCYEVIDDTNEAYVFKPDNFEVVEALPEPARKD